MIMASLASVLTYLLENTSGNPNHSATQVIRMAYLADWFHCLEHGHPISDATWQLESSGPMPDHLRDQLTDSHSVFDISYSDRSGKLEPLLSLKDRSFHASLSADERHSLDHIINISNRMENSDFVRTVFGTYPITTCSRYNRIDLQTKAAEYKERLQTL